MYFIFMKSSNTAYIVIIFYYLSISVLLEPNQQICYDELSNSILPD